MKHMEDQRSQFTFANKVKHKEDQRIQFTFAKPEGDLGG